MISAQIKAQVRQRAQNACEYCHRHQDDSPLAALHVEHIIPKIHGGSDDVENLALACIDCNLHKGTNLTGFDPETSCVPRKEAQPNTKCDLESRLWFVGSPRSLRLLIREDCERFREAAMAKSLC